MNPRVASLLLFLLAAARGSEALCSNSEMQSIVECFSPYNDRFTSALGSRPTDTTCRAEKITSQVCGWFSEIVTCVKGKNLNPQTCVQNAATQTNSFLVIPCTVQDLFAACPKAPCIWQLGNCHNQDQDQARGSEALCSDSEMQSIGECFSPYNVRFTSALGSRDSTCTAKKITSQVCGWFSEIVTCVKGKDLNPQTCVQNAASQTNELLVIPCTVQDLFAACPKAPCFWQLGNCHNNGSGGKGSTSFLWMTSLMTTCLAVVLAAHSG